MDGTLLTRIRTGVLQRRLRVAELFTDYDKLRKGTVTPAQFRRAVANIPALLTEDEVTSLVQKYAVGADRVNYRSLVSDIDVVFTESGFEKSPTKTLRPVGDLIAPRRATDLLSIEDAALQKVIRSFTRYCKVCGVDAKALFSQFDRHNRGAITAEQFRRVLPIDLTLTEAEVDVLMAPMRRDGGLVDYMALVDAVRQSEGLSSGTLPAPLVPIAAATPAEPEPQDVVATLRRAFHTSRVRPAMFFKDYDKLNSGRITENQFVRGLMLALDTPVLRGRLTLTPVQIQQVVEVYRTGDGKVDHKRFSRDVGGAFTVPIEGAGADVELETQPMLAPDELSRQDVLLDKDAALSEEEEDRVGAVLADLKHQIVTRRVDMYSIFRDFDTGYGFTAGVTPTQFSRALRTATLQIDEPSVSLLSHKFINGKGHVNYMKFCGLVDPFSRLQESNQLFFNTAKALAAKKPEQPLYDAAAVEPSGDLAAAMDLVQLYCVQRRVRAAACFQDYDRLRSGFITVPKFRAGLNAMVPTLPAASVEEIVKAYDRGGAPDEKRMAWADFCKDVDAVFTVKNLETKPDASVERLAHTTVDLLSRTSAITHHEAAEPAVAARVADVIAKIARSPYFDFEPKMRDFDVHNRSRVTATQFEQCLDYGRVSLSPDEKDDLVAFFSDNRGVNYRAFLDRLAPPTVTSPTTHTTSLLTVKRTPGAAAAKIDINDLLLKVQCKTITDGRRTIDYFKGFDRLNSGRVTTSVFQRGLDQAALRLSAAEIAALTAAYTSGEWVQYTKFSDDVESACAPPALEKDPLGATTTLTPLTPIELTALERKTKGGEVEGLGEAIETVSNVCRLRRLEMLPAFQDFDPTKNGSVSKNHFRRVLDRLGVRLTPFQIHALMQKYQVNVGGQHDVQYRNFAADVTDRAHALHAGYIGV